MGNPIEERRKEMPALPDETEITDTERLDWLITNSCTWNSRQPALHGRVAYGGCWDDGCPNYGGGGEVITPEAEDGNPRTAIDMAIRKEREKI